MENPGLGGDNLGHLRKYFIEGHDANNWGDVLMAASTMRMFYSSQVEVNLPRGVVGEDDGYLSRWLTGTQYQICSPKNKLFGFGRNYPSFLPRLASQNASKGDVVFFVNGYIFGDGWERGWIEQVGDCFKKIKNRGALVILMPQSFGPFEVTSDAVKNALHYSDLVFSRDAMSHQYLEGLESQTILERGIDYTGILSRSLPYSNISESERNCICVIPNIKIRERKGEAVFEQYLDWLNRLCFASVRVGLRVRLVSHTHGKDDAAIDRLSESNPDAEICRLDPFRTREIIGASRFVVTSRFHGLMNALTQNVPCVAIGWSHKYDEALRRYGMSGYNLEDFGSHTPKAILEKLRSNEVRIRADLEVCNAHSQTEYDRIKSRVDSRLSSS